MRVCLSHSGGGGECATRVLHRRGCVNTLPCCNQCPPPRLSGCGATWRDGQPGLGAVQPCRRLLTAGGSTVTLSKTVHVGSVLSKFQGQNCSCARAGARAVPHFVLKTLETLYPARYVYTVYQYIPNPRISELRSLILHSRMSSQDLVDSEITCPSIVEQENCAPRRDANGLGCS